ncbi:MAG TPA: signal peptide peptidase SppA [Planctomycetaceae bacterium]|nr:signal peptide peptidase SppA [Planctomycetaceae bacterium]
MSTEADRNAGIPVRTPPAQPPAVIIRQTGFFTRLRIWLLTIFLIISLVANYGFYTAYSEYFSPSDGPKETFHSGDRDATDKLAMIRVMGTIMPPFSERIVKTIKKAHDDKHVKGVLLVVDSPGGTVTDSHKIYHELKKLSADKPVVVSMGSLAASGGYFVSMGAGPQARIFAEPTTWTGSIGVIIPHYEMTGVAEKIGFKSAPLKTGEFKDSLSAFREMTPRDKEVWDNILNQAFDLFLDVIDENRDSLDKDQVRALATGQIYTAQDAKKNGMVDEIGFQDDALDALKKVAGLSTARVVSYHYALDLWDTLLGSAKANDPSAQWRAILEMTVPRAMYYCSWGPLPPAPQEGFDSAAQD